MSEGGAPKHQRREFIAAHKVRLMGSDVALVAFDLRNHDVVAVSQQSKRKACVTLDSIDFPALTL